jgi:hypothetical protein
METARRLPGRIQPPLAGFESLNARKCFSHEKRCFLLHFMTERIDATIEELYQRLITIPDILFADL